uniref:Uncharacterized protein n=1 Tax=Rhizophora mucronata TaxID=61149 RepID=A0A2P2R3K6_RHIMU
MVMSSFFLILQPWEIIYLRTKTRRVYYIIHLFIIA